MKNIYALLLVAFLPFNIHAAGSGEKYILKVEVTDSFFTVYSENGAIGNEGCEDSAKVVFWREDFPNGYSSMLSVALSAHMAGKKVTMWLNGCKSGPWGKTLPKAGSIVVLKN